MPLQSKTAPDFSPFARQYAESRPKYPPELFKYLASLTDQHHLAWDCATGSGQAAVALAQHFERVIATDMSAEQVRHAAQHPRIEYRVTRSEESGIGDHSVNLVTVATAIHWFDLDSFYSEVERVVCPGGILAAWTYHGGYVDPPFDHIFKHFYWEVVSSYFAQGARLVDDRYEDILLPGQAVEAPNFKVSAEWNFDQMIAFIYSWSGTQEYKRQRGEDPVDLIRDELLQIWGGRETLHTVRWPLYIKVSRVNAMEGKT